MRLKSFVFALMLFPAILHAQDVPYRVGHWDPDSLGNHRAVLHVDAPAKAVQVLIPWRRRDADPARKEIIVTTSAGRRVTNAVPIEVTRERGILAFEPSAGPGDYFVYFLPYHGSVKSNYPRITYRPADTTANGRWLAQSRLTPADIVAGQWRSLPSAQVTAIEAADSMSNRWPMEVIATEAETERMRRPVPFLLFAEDRTRPIIMTDELPQVWTAPGAEGRPVTGEALRGEFYVFQIGVWAQIENDVDSLTLTFGELIGPGGRTISADQFTSFNTGGVDWQGRPFTHPITIPKGRIQALWAGVMIPEDAPSGEWQGNATVSAAGGWLRTIPVQLTVKDSVITDHGDDEPWRLSRLRWLNSRLALDSTVVPPYTPVVVRGAHLEILGRTVDLARGGFPAQIASRFSHDMTTLAATVRPILHAPVRFEVTGTDGHPLTWTTGAPAVIRAQPGIAVWTATNTAGAITAQVRGDLEFDGTLEYHVALTARDTTPVKDVALVVPYRSDVAKYWMGLGRKGGLAPDSLDWSWDSTRNQDAAWVGDVNAGAQLSLFDDKYDRPLNTNFYQLKRLVMPRSWQNGGAGGCTARRTGAAAAATFTLRCASGARVLVPGDTLWYDFRLLVTPFHTIDPLAQFSNRFFHAYKPIPEIQEAGANVVNVHHATAINPYINYPFFRPAEMRAYADSAHAVGIRFKIYYTVRELTNRAPEFWALRSLGHEVFAAGPGGGHSWLQEHVGSDYITGWVVPELRDIALVTSGISRWHNHYVEGLDWLVRHEQIDGLYLDDVAFDRTTMQRMRRVLAQRPAPMIDLHSANQFNPNDGFASSANLYLEHFPYIDRLWFGEYFDYNSSPDYWLVEMSGIPYGLMGEMLQDGGNPWRGMLFGMTARLPWAGDPRPLWQVWDQFGIADAQMHGWWDPGSPVKTGRDDVLATAYVKHGKTLIAIASWAPDTVQLHLRIDWRALGIPIAHAALWAPAIDRFQEARTFHVGEAIPVAPGRGWVLVVE